MKKKYITPAAVMVEIQNCSIICTSPGDPVKALDTNADLSGTPSGDDDYEGDIR